MASDDWRLLTVTATETVAEDVRQLVLAHPDGNPLPEWEPGAHLEIETTCGIRQYSLCGGAGDDYTIAVLRETAGRGGSCSLHDTVTAGASLRVRGPRNHFPLADDADDYLLVAGGIGITPLKAMAQHLAASGKRWRLHYGGRSLASMAYVRELQALAPTNVEVVPEDTHGRLDLSSILRDANAGTVVYCCGPAGLLDAAAAAVAASPARSLHVERFSSGGEAVVQDEADTGEATFVVELAASGGEIEVGPDRSILEAVRDKLGDVPSSCEDGYCGTCETPVLEGIPLHRDTVLTASEQDSGEMMMICVSRSRSPRLVLDL